MSVRSFDRPGERNEINRFLRQQLGSNKAVGSGKTSLDEIALGRAESVVLGCRDGAVLVGALQAQVPMNVLQYLEPQIGLREAFGFTRRWRLLSHLAVKPSAQGAGIGTSLLAEMKTQVRASGGVGVFAFAEDYGRPSWPFYEKAGYRVLPEGSDLPPLDGVSLPWNHDRLGRWVVADFQS